MLVFLAHDTSACVLCYANVWITKAKHLTDILLILLHTQTEELAR